MRPLAVILILLLTGNVLATSRLPHRACLAMTTTQSLCSDA